MWKKIPLEYKLLICMLLIVVFATFGIISYMVVYRTICAAGFLATFFYTLNLSKNIEI